MLPDQESGESDGKGGRVKLGVCIGCRRVRYCSSECQNAHWKGGHRRECVKKKEESVSIVGSVSGEGEKKADGESVNEID